VSFKKIKIYIIFFYIVGIIEKDKHSLLQ